MSLGATKGRQPVHADAAGLDWDAVFADQLPRVLNYFRFRLARGADLADMEELTARTFEKAWRARGRYRRNLAGFSTWLFTIAHNVGTDYLRARREHLPIEGALQVPTEGTPLDSAEKDSDLAHLAELCVDMPPREHELIALKYGADLGHREIARLTGLTESNVGVILHRLVLKLRSQW